MTSSRSAVFEELVRFNRAQHLLRQFGDLPGAAMPLLAQVIKSGPLRSRQLAELSCLDPSTVSRQIDQLVRAGLVERLADPDDGRATLLHATATGQERFQAHRRQIEALLTDTLFREWSQTDLHTFTTLLRRLNDEAMEQLPHLARGYRAATSD